MHQPPRLPRQQTNPIMGKHALIFIGAAAVGFFAAQSLVGYQPFTFAYTQGAKIAG